MDTATRLIVPGLLAAAVAATVAVASAATPTPRAGGCIAPRLVGQTERTAVHRARAAGCAVHLAGAALKRASVQTVAVQSPAPGTRSVRAVVKLTLNPLCFGEALSGPPHDEGLRPGPTELITGLYAVGGPALPYSTPGCRPAPGRPTTGTVVVFDANGTPVASRTVTRARLQTFRLAPGRYRVGGRIGPGDALPTQPFTIRDGYTTHQYVIEPVP